MCTSLPDTPPIDPPIPFSLHNSLMLKACFVCATLISSLSVALQAVAAHLPDNTFHGTHGREMVHTAADIGLWHGIALCALIIGAPYFHPLRARLAYWGMITGTLLFSISVTLYGLNVTSNASPAPLGGFLLIFSWLLAASAVFQRLSLLRRE